jgi:transcriptional regulator with GAF, ATPase, and Fis domain
LYYRLSVFPLTVPPLRERIEDIVPLAHHFVTLICRELGRTPLRISGQDAERLQRHNWPGNIRELRNVIERAIIMSKGDRLRLDTVMAGSKLARSSTPDTAPDEGEILTDAEMREREKTNLLAALRRANWRVSGDDGAAELLGLKPSTLAYRMRVFGIERN